MNEKHRDSAYLRQGTSYQRRDTDPDPCPDRHQNLIVRSSAHCQPTFSEYFMQIRLGVCAQLLTEKNKQTNKQQRLRNLLGGDNNETLKHKYNESRSGGGEARWTL